MKSALLFRENEPLNVSFVLGLKDKNKPSYMKFDGNTPSLSMTLNTGKFGTNRKIPICGQAQWKSFLNSTGWLPII